MQLLEKVIRKNGFDYHLHTRGEKAFIYEQRGKTYEGKERIFAWEVFRKIVDPEKHAFNTTYPIRERFPANEDFGRWAWTISSEDRAIELFTKLEDGSFELEEENEEESEI